jgi:methyl-accepting chemotaxis protein WspA
MSNDNNTPDNEADSTDSGFVMPDNDGINSGHPMDEPEQDEFTTEAFNARMHGAQKKGSSTNRKVTNLQQGSSGQAAGLTIKNKLIGSYFILTLIIGTLGFLGYTTLTEVSSISEVIANDQAQLAKRSEELQVIMYKIRDAEKDYTYLEEQEYLDKVTRFTVSIRDKLKQLNLMAEQLSARTGIEISTLYAQIDEQTIAYENAFSTQVKSIKFARDEIDKNVQNVTKFQERLLDEVNKTYVVTETLVGDYWIDSKKEIGIKNSTSGSDKSGLNSANAKSESDIEIIEVGVMLSKLQQELLELQIQTSKYFSTGRQSYADLSRASVKNAQTMVNDVRVRVKDEKIASQMLDIGKNLAAYTGIFNEVTISNQALITQRTLTEQKIKSQLESLNSISRKLVEYSEILSANAWKEISIQSKQLVKLSDDSQVSLLSLAILGTLIGLIVLIWIPRPILSGISQLLAGAQKVASGDLTVPVQVKNRDELGNLAETFERMRSNLQGLVIRNQNASIQITSAVNEIQAAANQQSSTANEQAASINEFRSTMGEMSRTSNELASIVAEINGYAEKVSEHVNISNGKSVKLLESMGLINDSTQQTSGRIKSLNDQMDTINDAVTVISGVADQTTLLSMNASIEANKAGEMGKGFSVVAYEIRRLSDRAIDSAGDITGKVRDIQRATENSVVAMDKSSEEIRLGIDQVRESTDTLQVINESLDGIRSQMGDVTAGTKDQAQASSQAQQTAIELAESSRMVSQAAKQTVTATFEINAMANQLAESVASFKT